MLCVQMIRVLVLLVALLSGLAGHVLAASLSGIVLYSTDDFGFPSGVVTHDNPDSPEFHMWRTRAQPGRWHGLGVFPGAVPNSLAARPLNFPDFSIEFPLDEGVNEFTLIGEPGPITWGDDYQRFALNLYFDGVFEQPGISVLFPRFAPAEGVAPSENRAAEAIYSFDLYRVQFDPAMVYDDGIYTVSVEAVSFLPPERFVSVNLVDKYVVAPGGEPDGIGTLRLLVEPSGGGNPVVGPGPAFSGIPQGTARRVAPPAVGPELMAPQVGGGPARPQVAPARRDFETAEPQPWDGETDDRWASGDAAEEDEIPNEATPTEGAESTPVRSGTPTPPTPTPAATLRPPDRTGTPAVTGTPAGTPTVPESSGRTVSPTVAGVAPTPTAARTGPASGTKVPEHEGRLPRRAS